MSASQSSQSKRKRADEDGEQQLTTSSRVHVWGLPKNSLSWIRSCDYLSTNKLRSVSRSYSLAVDRSAARAPCIWFVIDEDTFQERRVNDDELVGDFRGCLLRLYIYRGTTKNDEDLACVIHVRFA